MADYILRGPFPAGSRTGYKRLRKIVAAEIDLPPLCRLPVSKGGHGRGIARIKDRQHALYPLAVPVDAVRVEVRIKFAHAPAHQLVQPIGDAELPSCLGRFRRKLSIELRRLPRHLIARDLLPRRDHSGGFAREEFHFRADLAIELVVNYAQRIVPDFGKE